MKSKPETIDLYIITERKPYGSSFVIMGRKGFADKTKQV